MSYYYNIIKVLNIITSLNTIECIETNQENVRHSTHMLSKLLDDIMHVLCT